ncbi:MAG: hypothetical protein GX371_05890 [Bacteroidales bacterium]|nr:hypothetical protein [Bacteroidales bacterium]
MDIQFFIVILIGIAVGAILLRGLYRFFFDKKKSPYCGSCTLCTAPPVSPDKKGIKVL